MTFKVTTCEMSLYQSSTFDSLVPFPILSATRLSLYAVTLSVTSLGIETTTSTVASPSDVSIRESAEKSLEMLQRISTQTNRSGT